MLESCNTNAVTGIECCIRILHRIGNMVIYPTCVEYASILVFLILLLHGNQLISIALVMGA